MGARDCACVGEECRWAGFLLGHPHPGQFVSSQWRGPRAAYLAYRIAVAVYVLVWGIVRVVEDNGRDGWHWFTYFTHWTLIVLASNLIYQAILVAVYGYCKRLPLDGVLEEDRLVCPLKLMWPWTNAAYSATLVSTLLYWAVLLQPTKSYMSASSINIHGVNSALVLLDVFLTAMPLRIFHFFHGFLLGLAYIAFNLIYYLSGGINADGQRFIYTAMNWRDGRHAVATSLLLLASFVVVWLVLWMCFQIRLLLTRLCACGQAAEPADETERVMGETEKGTIGLDNYGATHHSTNEEVDTTNKKP